MAWPLSSDFLFQNLWELPVVYCIKSEPICLVCKACNNLTPPLPTTSPPRETSTRLLPPATCTHGLLDLLLWVPTQTAFSLHFILLKPLLGGCSPSSSFLCGVPSHVSLLNSFRFLPNNLQGMYYLIAQIEPLIISFLGL